MWSRSILLALTVALTLGATASARPRVEPFQPQWVMPAQDRGEARRELRPLRDIVEGLRARHGGDLISARLEDGPQPIYVLRWRMPDGQVRDFRVDAVSGQPR